MSQNQERGIPYAEKVELLHSIFKELRGHDKTPILATKDFRGFSKVTRHFECITIPINNTKGRAVIAWCTDEESPGIALFEGIKDKEKLSNEALIFSISPDEAFGFSFENHCETFFPEKTEASLLWCRAIVLLMEKFWDKYRIAIK